MANLFYIDGKLINLDHVWEVEAVGNGIAITYVGGHVEHIKLSNGDSVCGDIENSCSPIIPAAPGYQLLQFRY